MPEPDLALLVKNNISLLAPAEEGLTWSAEFRKFESRFIVENIDPIKAIQTCVDKLKNHGLFRS